MNAHMAALKAAIRELLIDLDVFGLRARPKVLRLQRNVEAEAWRFATDDQKIIRFREWLQGRIDAGLLSVDAATGNPWNAEFVHSAYRQGVLRSYIDARRVAIRSGEIDDDSFLGGGREEFLRQTFAAPEATAKLRLLQTRTLEALKGVTQQMGADMSRILADGIAAGLHPRVIARQMAARIDNLNITRARTIARTEIIHAHAEGQLDGFEKLGVEEVGVLAEWLTAGDDRVCPRCNDMEGVVLTIKEARGMIPRHPNCRCMWVPVDDEKRKGQKRGQAQIRGAIRASIRSERPKASAATALSKSRWIGKVKKIGKR